MNALFVIGHDGYVRPSYNLLHSLIKAGGIARAVNVSIDLKFLSPRQQHPFDGLEQVSMDDLAKLCASTPFDLIFLGLGGKHFQGALELLRLAAPSSRLISFFPGLSPAVNFSGCASRYGADAILFNCAADLNFYQRMCTDIGGDCSNAHLLGYPQIGDDTPRPRLKSAEDIRTITYFDQNVVPENLAQRRYLLGLLVALASENPNREVVVQVRNASRENSPHPPRYGLAGMARKHGRLPPNLTFNHSDVYGQIERTDLALGISSTVLIECIARGILTYSLADFGIRADYANSYFSGTGILKPASCVLEDLPTYPDAAWIGNFASAYEDRFRRFLFSSLPTRSAALPAALAAYERQEAHRVSSHRNFNVIRRLRRLVAR
jgi:hypothetical protein